MSLTSYLAALFRNERVAGEGVEPTDIELMRLVSHRCSIPAMKLIDLLRWCNPPEGGCFGGRGDGTGVEVGGRDLYKEHTPVVLRCQGLSFGCRVQATSGGTPNGIRIRVYAVRER